MSGLPAELWESVRRRANGVCEYCGVTETTVGGGLTVDHYRPRAAGGTDDDGNLVYCCHRCNLYKGNYWPSQPSDIPLWNPRLEPREQHLLELANGNLHPITPTGAFTLAHLVLNRPALVQHRLSRFQRAEDVRSLEQYREMAQLLKQMQEQLFALLREHGALLKQRRDLLKLRKKRRG